MKASWKRLWSCFAFFGITWGALNVAQAAKPFSSQAIKQHNANGNSQGSQGSQSQSTVKKTPVYPLPTNTGIVPPHLTTPKPPTKPIVRNPVIKPPFGAGSPIVTKPPITLPPKPVKPPQIVMPFPFPPVVTNPPVKPPVKPPFIPPVHPLPPIVVSDPPVKPPHGPIHPPIDPGIPPIVSNPPSNPPTNPPGNPPANPGNNGPHCPPHCWPPIFGHCIPGWGGYGGGYGGGFGGPIVVQPYPVYGGNVVTVGATMPTLVTVPAPVVEAVTQSFDLELLDLRLVDDGLAADQGPRYRVTIRNLGRTDIASQITVAVLASAQAQPNADAQYATTTLESLKAVAMQTVDVRLPVQVAQQPQAFGFLAAAVALTDGSADANPTNNGSTYERAAVRDVDLRLDTVRVEGNKLILVGEGFGRSAGKLTLQIGAAQHVVQTASWTATEVGFAMPTVDAQGADHGQLQLVRADGRTVAPLAINFAR